MDSRSIQQIVSKITMEYCCCWDTDLTFVFGAQKVSEFLGRLNEATATSIVELILPEDACSMYSQITEQINKYGQVEILMPLVKGDGTVVWALNRGVVEQDNGKTYIVGTITEATLLKLFFDEQITREESYRNKLMQTESMVKALSVKAEQDSLTKLYNAGTSRSLCEEYFNNSNENSALMVIDLDEFKQVNDNYGHLVGDMVLMQAASVIRRLFRSQDIVGRVGGDEFIVLMKDIPDLSIVLTRCEQVIEQISLIEYGDLKKGEIHCSIGMALSFGNEIEYTELFDRADRALYKAKASGKNCFELSMDN